MVSSWLVDPGKGCRTPPTITSLFVISDNNDTVADAVDSGSMAVTPEQQAAVDNERKNQLKNNRAQLANIIGPARNARSAAD